MDWMAAHRYAVEMNNAIAVLGREDIRIIDSEEGPATNYKIVINCHGDPVFTIHDEKGLIPLMKSLLAELGEKIDSLTGTVDALSACIASITGETEVSND